MSNDWNVQSVEVRSSGNRGRRNRIIMKVTPGYDNKKKYDGEMDFLLTDEQLATLRNALDDFKETKRRLEIAQEELNVFGEEQRVERQSKKKELREKLGLEGDPDLPEWLKD